MPVLVVDAQPAARLGAEPRVEGNPGAADPRAGRLASYCRAPSVK